MHEERLEGNDEEFFCPFFPRKRLYFNEEEEEEGGKQEIRTSSLCNYFFHKKNMKFWSCKRRVLASQRLTFLLQITKHTKIFSFKEKKGCWKS